MESVRIISKEMLAVKSKKIELYAPLKGRVVPLSTVGDLVFSEKVLGDGLGIIPETEMIVSPADGKVENIPRTNHAITLSTVDGAEILIHIGIDTVNLKGKYYTPLVRERDFVKMGEPLIEFDRVGIESEGYDIVTVVVVTNSDKYERIEATVSFASEQKPFMVLKEKVRGE